MASTSFRSGPSGHRLCDRVLWRGERDSAGDNVTFGVHLTFQVWRYPGVLRSDSRVTAGRG